MTGLRDEFLSEEDLDLRSLGPEEFYAHWNLWLEQAQATNDNDRTSYSHGVFMLAEEPLQDEQCRQVAEQRTEYGRGKP